MPHLVGFQQELYLPLVSLDAGGVLPRIGQHCRVSNQYAKERYHPSPNQEH